jgi:aspartyl protease family protein
MRRRALGGLFAAAALGGLARPAAAQAAVAYAGRMGARALLVIDGQTRTLAVGDSVAGVRLRALDDGTATVESAGRVFTLTLGGQPLSVGAPAPTGQDTELVLTAGPGGHFVTDGTVNGRSIRFLVDTGASMVSFSQADADRLGVDWKRGERGAVQTANGTTAAWRVTLAQVGVGGLRAAQVPALVTGAPMPFALLGNSFLTRFQMQRLNDQLRLTPRG